MAEEQDTNLQVIQGELAGGFLVELQRNLQLVQLFSETCKLLEVIIRHLQQLQAFREKQGMTMEQSF